MKNLLKSPLAKKIAIGLVGTAVVGGSVVAYKKFGPIKFKNPFKRLKK